MSKVAIKLAVALAAVAGAGAPAPACTIFVLADTNHAFFCNNEDWSNPKTRIWFVPPGEGYLGCVYVGFDNGWGQGGLNTAGLAFDWVAGWKEQWQPGRKMKAVRGNPSERMLETCATVDDAIAFYRTHRETSFTYAKILVADRTGASAIIGAENGRLRVDKTNGCRGFGYGRRILQRVLPEGSEVSAASGASILRTCLQSGQYATRYSNIYDLRTGEIFLFRFPDQSEAVKLNLAAELSKGAHYYEIPEIHTQLATAPLPLANNMKRFFLDEFKPVPDKEPHITKHLRAALCDAIRGAMRADDYTTAWWTNWSLRQEAVRDQLAEFGPFEYLTLVERKAAGDTRTYRYRVEFKKASLLLRADLDQQDKIALVVTEHVEQKAAVE